MSDYVTLLISFSVLNKTKVMASGESQKLMQKAARWPCGVCGRGVSNNTVQCSSYQKWVHKKCTGAKGSMSKVEVAGT